jgi:gliding motility-associated-like protein
VTDTIIDNGVSVLQPVIAAFDPVNASLLLPADTITFVNQSTGAASYFWNWDFGHSVTVNAFATFPEPGTYPVMLKAYNASGCSDSVEHYITIVPPMDYFIPNVFTPNGDGVNDLFFVKSGQGVSVLKFEIFDRWGEKLYDGLLGWDGTYNGKLCEHGVYLYTVELQVTNYYAPVKRKGSLTLLR